MTSEQWEAFFSTARTGSMKKAAAQLFISQPALKKRIDSLEAELGAALLRRTNTGCELTDTGEQLYRKLYPQYIKMKRTISEICGSREQMWLRVCQVPHLNLRPLDQLLSDFVHEHKTISIDRSFITTQLWQDAFLKGSIDLIPLPGTLDYLDQWHEAGYVPLLYGRGELVCIMAGDHPLARRHALTLQDLRGYRIYSETILLTMSGLAKAAAESALQISAHQSALSRYDMSEQARNGVLYLHDSGLADDVSPLAAVPVTDVDYGRYLLLQNDTSKPLSLLKEYLLRHGFSQQ